ncbi:hypothetical protein WIW50_17810 [Flavobacteriaceae bacterium 3-367]|uniref:hypothetical protein n=1 Tax=Eudoraea algarum TaxID=3417568 RepID=UPI0032697086
MKPSKLSSLSLGELKKKEKSLKMAIGLLAGAVLIMYGAQIYNYVETKEVNTLMLLPLVFTFLVIANYVNLKKITAEIKSREDVS